jgi:hypothetical protein
MGPTGQAWIGLIFQIHNRSQTMPLKPLNVTEIGCNTFANTSPRPAPPIPAAALLISTIRNGPTIPPVSTACVRNKQLCKYYRYAIKTHKTQFLTRRQPETCPSA